MPRKAIFTYYTVDQNEPSKPSSQLHIMPDDPAELEEALRKEWFNTFIGNNEEECPALEIEERSDYGDLSVSDGDNVVFVTYLSEDHPEVAWSEDHWRSTRLWLEPPDVGLNDDLP